MTEHEFVLWLARITLATDRDDNTQSYQELILRKLEKVGAVSVRNGIYRMESDYDIR